MAGDRRVVTFFLKNSYGAPSVPLETLSRVDLHAPPDARVHDLAKEAFTAAGLPVPEHYNILFVFPPDRDGHRVLAPYLEVGVREDGLLYWRVGAGSARTTVGDVERAKREGLFEGDPHAYSVDRGGYGDSGIFVYWDDLLRFLRDLDAVGGGTVVLAAFSRRLRRIVTDHLAGWTSRHARFPDTFFNSVVQKAEWDPLQLSRLLDISEEDAANLLIALGYAAGSDGIFRITNDPEKAHLRKRLAEQHYLWDGWHEARSGPSDDEPPG